MRVKPDEFWFSTNDPNVLYEFNIVDYYSDNYCVAHTKIWKRFKNEHYVLIETTYLDVSDLTEDWKKLDFFNR